MTEFFRRKMAFFRQVHAFVVKTVRSLAGAIRVTDAVAGNAQAVLVEGDAWVRNQLSPAVTSTRWLQWNASTSGENVAFDDATGVASVTTVSRSNSVGIQIKNAWKPNYILGHIYMISCEAKGPAGFYISMNVPISGEKISAYKALSQTDSWELIASNQCTCVVGGVGGIIVSNNIFRQYSEDVVTFQLRNVQLVDLTQLCNGDAAKIAAITSWDDLVAQYPEYGSYVAYNTGEVVGLQSTFTTGVWNQLAQVTTNQDAGCGISVIVNEDNSVTLSGTVSRSSPNIIYLTSNMVRLVAGHKYYASWGINRVTWAPPFRLQTANASFYFGGTGTEGFSTNDGRSNYGRLVYSVSPVAEGVELDVTFLPVVIDLTLLFGPGHEPTTVQEVRDYCAAIGHPLTQYQAYDAGTTLGGTASTETLYAAGTAHDTQDVASGEVTRRIGSVDMGTLNWGAYNSDTGASYPYGSSYTSSLTDRAVGMNMACASYVVRSDAKIDMSIFALSSGTAIWLINSSFMGMTGAQIKEALSGVMLYYELATPTTSAVTAQPLALQKGSNSIYQTDAGRTASFEMTYTATQ